MSDNNKPNSEKQSGAKSGTGRTNAEKKSGTASSSSKTGSSGGRRTTRKQEVKKIKNYSITGIIGKGGMGQVFLAKHPTLGRQIILKHLKLRDKESKERFLLEAKVMMDFRHENIVQFYDHFKEGQATYIAMEYVKGKALNQIIEEQEMIPVPLALFIMYQAALGLYHAHNKKVIHRDIKPHNILISDKGDVKITDFGIATKESGGLKESNLTAPGTVIGTPAYMGPEQFSTSKEITHKTDIYSLGIVFYEMITGVRPYKNEFSSDVIEAISKGKHVGASKYVKDLPPIAKKILKKSFNPDVNKRYKSLYYLVKTLKKYFAKYNLYELKDSVRRLVENEKNFDDYPIMKHYRDIHKKSSRRFTITATVATVTVLTFLFFYTNRYYEWIAAGSYGKVEVQFRKANLDEDNTFLGINGKYEKVNFKKGKILQKIEALTFDEDIVKKVSKDEQVFLSAIYEKEKAKEGENDKALYYILNRKLNKDEKKRLLAILEKTYFDNFSKVFYLKTKSEDKTENKADDSREFLFTVASGSYKNERRAVILPIRMQSKNSMTKSGQKVNIPISELWRQDVNLYFRFWNSLKPDQLLFTFNSYSGSNVNELKQKLMGENDELQVLNKGRYITLKTYISYFLKPLNKYSPFYSDNTYKFKVRNYTHNGIKYDDKIFDLKLALDDRTIVAHIPLIPTPATIKIKSNLKSLPLLLTNESKGYIYKDGDYEYVEYKKIKPEKLDKNDYLYTIQIPPGSYVLQVKKDGAKKNLNLGSGDTIEMKIEKKDGKIIY